jgi:ATP phosphoribosyltransferase
MAFAESGLQLVASGKNNVWIYKSADSNATIVASGYFNSVYQYFRQHDVIFAISATGGTPILDPIFITSATGATTVTTSVTET